jgi:2-hydroxy-4-carboxymuconate semialdehyde hemiacetal dehydrogenase
VTVPIGIALVGAGRIAHSHAQAIARSTDATLLAVVDRDAAVAGTFAAEYGAGFSTTSLDAAMDVPGIDALIVCTPTSLHHDNARAALARGIHALVEKPFAASPAEAAAMVDAADAAGLQLMSGQVLRFMPMFSWARDFVAEGRLGEPVQAVERRLTYRRDNFPWWKDLPQFLVSHWGSHSIDILCHLLDDEVSEVYCDGASIASEFGVIDDFTLQARYSSGLRAAISMSFTSRYLTHDLVIIGRDATLQFDCYRRVTVDGETVLELPEDDMIAAGFDAQLAAFAAGIRGEQPLASSGRSALRSLAALAAAEQSVTLGRPVRPENPPR